VSADNALQVAEHMITLLLKQNEQRNLAMLRLHDVLVRPMLNDIAFADFHRAKEIIGRGEVALASVDAAWQKMLQSKALLAVAAAPLPLVKEKPICLAEIRVSGHDTVSADFIRSRVADLQGQLFDASVVAQLIDLIYTTGYFEQVTYSLEPLDGVCHALVVHVREKPYGPHFFKTALGFSTELDGVTQFSLGVGYRRPWLTSEGLELQLGARVGTLTEFNARLVQPLGVSWQAEVGFGMHSNAIPVYEPLEWSRGSSPRKFAYMRDLRQEVSASIGREFDNESIMKLGLVQAVQRYKVDVSKTRLLVNGSTFTMPDYSLNYSAVRWQWDVDQLDAVSFPTKGYAWGLLAETGVSSTRYLRSRVNAQWVRSWEVHTLSTGLYHAQDKLPRSCNGSCTTTSPLLMGGFQFMGAYRMGQLSGDELGDSARGHHSRQGGDHGRQLWWICCFGWVGVHTFNFCMRCGHRWSIEFGDFVVHDPTLLGGRTPANVLLHGGSFNARGAKFFACSLSALQCRPNHSSVVGRARCQ
jgi:NTE family protein